MDVWMEFSCGATGFLKGCRADDFSIFEMDIIGTGGRMRIIESGTHFELYEKQRDFKGGPGYLVKVLDEDAGFKDFMLDLVQNVVASLEGKAVPKCVGLDGLKALEVATAIRESADQAQKIYYS
jgi:predicted dehydrogenase